MEFLVEFKLDIPIGAPVSEVHDREEAEAVAAAKLAGEGHLLRVWKRSGEATILGLYRAASRAELNGVLRGLPLADWMDVTVTPLEPHPNDPDADGARATATAQLPAPHLTLIYRLDITLGQPLDFGPTPQGRRRIVPQTGGTFTGPELQGTLLPGASADWQVVLADGTALADIRYTLQTDRGDLLYVQSRGVRHGSADVLARLGRGEDVDPSEYTFRTATHIETAAPSLDWLNKGVFISVGARRAAGVSYETYLVG